MKTKELIRLLEVAEQLGQSDIPMKWQDGRNGEVVLVDAKASFYALPGLRQDGIKAKNFVLLITRD